MHLPFHVHRTASRRIAAVGIGAEALGGDDARDALDRGRNCCRHVVIHIVAEDQRMDHAVVSRARRPTITAITKGLNMP
jgi:hypothetical protein